MYKIHVYHGMLTKRRKGLWTDKSSVNTEKTLQQIAADSLKSTCSYTCRIIFIYYSKTVEICRPHCSEVLPLVEVVKEEWTKRCPRAACTFDFPR